MEPDIYQKIWDEDQKHAGIKAITANDAKDSQKGYVVVDETKTPVDKKNHRLLPDSVIPASKQKSYDRVAVLFNNYTLDQTKLENPTPEEAEEVRLYIDYIQDTPPMQVAREYLAARTPGLETVEAWKTLLRRVWFEQFRTGNNPEVSGFEHVLVGEQEGGKVQGYHFWWKYFIDEHFRNPEEPDVDPLDLIGFIRWENVQGDKTPDSVTLKFQWNAFDYEAKKFRPLTKPKGGFWVGPSAEGLMAMGTVRFSLEAAAPKVATINGYRYKLELFRSPNDRNLRTFYPVLQGPAPA